MNKVLYWLVFGGLLLLAITPLLVSTSLFFPFITGKGFFFRAVMEIILALWIILAIREPAYRPRQSWLLTAMSVFLLILALATAWGANPYRSFWSNFERMEGLISYLHLFAYFLVLISVLKTERLWRKLFAVSSGVSLFIGFYGLMQLSGELAINQGGVRADATFGNATYLAVYLLFHLFILAFLFLQKEKEQNTDNYPNIFLAGITGAGLFIFYAFYNYILRLPPVGSAAPPPPFFLSSGWHIGWNLSEKTIFFLSVILLTTLIYFLSQHARKHREKWIKIITNFLFVFLGILQIRLLYFTATRGAILGFGLGLIISAILIIWRERQGIMMRRTAWVTLGLAVAVIIVFFAVKNSSWVAQSPTLSRFASISVDDRTTQSRFLVWNMSWQGFKARPLLGWGPENYILVFNKYYDPAMYNQEPWFDRSHNIVFDWLISAGAFGLLSYLSLFGIAWYLLWWKKNNLSTTERSLFTGLLVAYFFHNLFVFDNLVSYLLFFAVLGYVHFKSTEESQVSPAISHSKNQWPLTPIIVTVAVLFLPTFYWLNAKPWLANRTLIEALSLQKYPQDELARFKKVFAYQTFASTEASEQMINFALGVAQNQSIPVEDRTAIALLARDQILATIKREPENARYPFFLGSFLLRFGLSDEAKTHLDKARQLTPRKQAVFFELGALSINQKKYDEALAFFRTAYELDKSYQEAIKLYALGAVYSKDLPLAATLLDEGAKNDPAFLLDQRLVESYGAINQPNALVAVWQKAIVSEPKFQQAVLDFIADLKKRDIIQ